MYRLVKENLRKRWLIMLLFRLRAICSEWNVDKNVCFYSYWGYRKIVVYCCCVRRALNLNRQNNIIISFLHVYHSFSSNDMYRMRFLSLFLVFYCILGPTRMDTSKGKFFFSLKMDVLLNIWYQMTMCIYKL